MVEEVKAYKVRGHPEIFKHKEQALRLEQREDLDRLIKWAVKDGGFREQSAQRAVASTMQYNPDKFIAVLAKFSKLNWMVVDPGCWTMSKAKRQEVRDALEVAVNNLPNEHSHVRCRVEDALRAMDFEVGAANKSQSSAETILKELKVRIDTAIQEIGS